jgi:hypothetical protein
MRLPLILCAAVMAVTPAFATTSSAVRDVLSKPTPAARKSAIAFVVKRDCGLTLDADQLAKASAFVEANRDKGVDWITHKIAESELGAVCG